MLEVTIKVEGLEQLSESLALLGSALAYREGEDIDVVVDKMQKVKENDAPTEPKQVKTAETEKKDAPTREEVRAEFVKRNTKENRKKLQAVLKKYDAKNISTLAEEHFEGVMTDLEAI